MPACLAAYWKASPRLGAVVKRGIKDMLTQGRGENVLLGPPMLEESGETKINRLRAVWAVLPTVDDWMPTV